ncbi:MAG: Methylenetetrahydrofolate dehydrogenase / Methenyltetrahydrofolate cyclohydrolase [Candidatus Peribacteria bacterium]|nr:Methylenetetrahydrofolate dehydrogenase / Methenyltetrahydrofolate cyclohydrolase [Candidatus Peribacteria bacterium]
MTARILSGTEVATAILETLKKKVKQLDPKLVVVQAGDNAASNSYIKQKLKSCEAIGMRHEHIQLAEETGLPELMMLIENLNREPDVSGFIIQLPLPKQLEKHTPQILRAITPTKDVDGFGAYNLGKTFLSKEFEDLPPATPAGVIELLHYYKVPIEGQHAVVVGRSNIVGKPLAIMLLNRGATVTVCHSKTAGLSLITKQADILFCAVGKPGMITADMVKPGAVVIDIGVSRDEEGLKGDTDFISVSEVASAITPTPGGVGPMTVASLLRNVVRAKQRQVEMINKTRNLDESML